MTSVAQLCGSSRALVVVALPFATLGCATGVDHRPKPMPDATQDVDARGIDAPAVTADAPPDAGCAISVGTTIVLDGDGDLAKYTAAQQLTPGAALGTTGAAIAWDSSHLFATFTSNAFTAPYEPLHLYVETGAALGTPLAASGKEYSGLTPAVPFSPTHLIAVRRISDAGTGGYDGVFVPSDQWQTRVISLDTTTFASTDQRTLSVTVPWSALGGCPTAMRLAVHVVHGQAANEWKELVPATHTPWVMPGGGYYDIDLTVAPAVASWTLR